MQEEKENINEDLNEPSGSSLDTITKVDGDNNALNLEGAIYELYDADMNIMNTFAATDTNGIATITRLDKATYYLKEKVAPVGYQLPDPNLVL